MNRTGVWILGVAAGCFLAGLAVGFALPAAFAAARDEAAADPDEDYVRHMIADYRLDAEQSRLLRMAIRMSKDEELQVFRQFQVDQLPREMQDGLRDVGSRLVQRTRQNLRRDPGQLARYDEMVRAEGSR